MMVIRYVMLVLFAVTVSCNRTGIDVYEPDNLNLEIIRRMMLEQYDNRAKAYVDYEYLVIDTGGCTSTPTHTYFNGQQLGFTSPALMDTLGRKSGKMVRTQQWYAAQLDSIVLANPDSNVRRVQLKAFKLKTMRYELCAEAKEPGIVRTGEYYFRGNGDTVSVIQTFVWGRIYAPYHWRHHYKSVEIYYHKVDSL